MKKAQLEQIGLEDEFGDVIRKARAGLRLSAAEIAEQAQFPLPELEKAEQCQLIPKEPVIRKIASLLDLKSDALIDLALRRYQPSDGGFDQLRCAAMLRSNYGGGIVNCFAIWDEASNQGAFFDTGMDIAALEQLQNQHGFDVRYLFLTHTHGDHVHLLDEVRKQWDPTVVGSRHEPVIGARLIAGDTQFVLGMLTIEAFPTPGHSPGGLSYYVEGFGPDQPALCICGDVLFAGSAGGAMHSYPALMKSVRERLLKLEPETILGPGHGPLTTVAQERQHNPFAP